MTFEQDMKLTLSQTFKQNHSFETSCGVIITHCEKISISDHTAVMLRCSTGFQTEVQLLTIIQKNLVIKTACLHFLIYFSLLAFIKGGRKPNIAGTVSHQLVLFLWHMLWFVLLISWVEAHSTLWPNQHPHTRHDHSRKNTLVLFFSIEDSYKWNQQRQIEWQIKGNTVDLPLISLYCCRCSVTWRLSGIVWACALAVSRMLVVLQWYFYIALCSPLSIQLQPPVQ